MFGLCVCVYAYVYACVCIVPWLNLDTTIIMLLGSIVGFNVQGSKCVHVVGVVHVCVHTCCRCVRVCVDVVCTSGC